MSLVIAFIGTQGAAMAGDMREISFGGPPEAICALEEELYPGSITTDAALAGRARDLGVTLRIRDNKVKVADRGGILVGEVGEREGSLVRIRRVYASAGRYALADFENGRGTRTSEGQGSNFVVLGNEIAKQVAHRCITTGWKNGTLEDALRILVRIMEEASRATASVGRNFLLVQTRSSADPACMAEEDRRAMEGLKPSP